jgi:hypothetical protein
VIEEGIYQLVANNSGVQSALSGRSVSDSGIYPMRAPSEPIAPFAVYRLVSDAQQNLLTDVNGVVKRRIQFSCFGPTAAAAITLSRAIIAVLNGFAGTLGDSQTTRVTQILKDNDLDSDADDPALFLRMIDFLVFYTPSVTQS